MHLMSDFGNVAPYLELHQRLFLQQGLVTHCLSSAAEVIAVLCGSPQARGVKYWTNPAGSAPWSFDGGQGGEAAWDFGVQRADVPSSALLAGLTV